ncbi:MAG: glycosyltransferase family 4 protein [Caldilineaceae bacterium]|nr:glycosyltransferase family 4 protein [Caldilineaceae bacterium]
MYESSGKLQILRVLLAIRETSAPYNLFFLPWANKHDISICTFFTSDVTPPETLTLFEGNGSVTGFIRALKAALDAKEYDIIHIHAPHLGFLFLIANLFSNRKFAHSTVITVHDSYQNYKFRNRLMYLPVFANFQRIVCCSRASYDSFPALYRWLAGDRLRFVQNGLDLSRVDRIAANHQRSEQTGDFLVVAISRLVDIKSPFSVLAAFQQAADPSSKLVYMGDGPLRQSLIAKREATPEARIEFTGLIPREKVFENLLNADLFISTSLGEGLPIAVLEAMACRCPVLLSDIQPHREIAQGTDFIPLVPVGDVAGFAREIKRFREMPAAERARIGQACRDLVEEKFSLRAMHAGYEEVYAQITNHPALSYSGA